MLLTNSPYLSIRERRPPYDRWQQMDTWKKAHAFVLRRIRIGLEPETHNIPTVLVDLLQAKASQGCDRVGDRIQVTDLSTEVRRWTCSLVSQRYLHALVIDVLRGDRLNIHATKHCAELS